MSEPKPKKIVSRSVVIALGIICVVLLGSLAYFVVADNSTQNSYNNLENQNKQLQESNANLQDQNRQLQTWLNGNETMLNQTQAWLLGNESSPTQTETWLKGNETLLNQTQAWLAGNESLLFLTENWLNGNVTYYGSPELGLTDLTVEDNRTNPQTPNLYINGVVQNFGIGNSSESGSLNQLPTFGWIQVEAYHGDGSLALNSHREEIGNIVGQSSMNVTMNLYYNGTPITSWTINLGIVYILD